MNLGMKPSFRGASPTRGDSSSYGDIATQGQNSGLTGSWLRNIGVILLLWGVFSEFGLGQENRSQSDLSHLSVLEEEEIQNRLKAFYRIGAGNPEVMNQRVPKFDLTTRKWAPLRYPWASQSLSQHPLQVLSGVKSKDSFHAFRCRQIYQKHFPKLYRSECLSEESSRATFEANDRVEQLVEGWIDPNEVVYHLDRIPNVGETALPLWSDDYWRTVWGQTSYRYSERRYFLNYLEAIQHYTQPAQWLNLLGTSASSIADVVTGWSPAEKYDLTVHDENFGLTNQQKNEGRAVLDSTGEVESWMGLCHGWAAAAIGVVPPQKAAVLVGPRNVRVTWYPNDVKAMATLAWANGNYVTNYVGGRCNSKQPELFANGRIREQKCFDNNPATFHLALGNMIGRQKLSFVMDKVFDYEVWNQPIHSYQFVYFNPLNSQQTSSRWQDVIVDYDDSFRQQDRFQSPLTRGVRTPGGGYEDRHVKKIVGVIATVTYLVEHRPNHSPFPDQSSYQRETYTYDLEFQEWQGHYYPSGGEWHQNSHPDFLWVHRKGTFPVSQHDVPGLMFSGDAVPSSRFTETAKNASRVGMPLCRVMKELTRRSTTKDTYPCP